MRSPFSCLAVVVVTVALAFGCSSGEGDGGPACAASPVPTESPRTPIDNPPVACVEDGKWNYTPAQSTCVYTESTTTQALYQDFTNAEVLLMDSQNCAGSWYVFFPSTGEAHGGLSEPDSPRLRLRLIDDKVRVLPGNDGCEWVESSRRPDNPGERGTIVHLDTTCDYDHWFVYSSETGALDGVID